MRAIVDFFGGKLRLSVIIAFVLIELVLAFVIQLVPFRLFGTFAYLSVVLAFLVSFLSLKVKKSSLWAARLGLLFTLGADFFLVVLVPDRQLAGVLVFILAQLAYAAYLHIDTQTRVKKNVGIAIRLTLSVLAAILPLAVLGNRADPLSFVSVIYYAQLITNLILAIVLKKPLFAFALFLFSLCDLSIGLKTLSASYIQGGRDTFLYAITHTEVNLAWVFYLPSQVLIALSIVFNKNSRPT